MGGTTILCSDSNKVTYRQKFLVWGSGWKKRRGGGRFGGFGGLEAGIEGKGLVSFVNSHTRFGIFSDPFFKEVRFSLEAYQIHPFKRVACVVVSAASKGD